MASRRMLSLADAPASARVHTSDQTWLLRALLIGAGVGYLTFALRNSFVQEGTRIFTLFDDAMISMRYAKNLAHGSGLVWNPGEAPVEGYTNFLWTLWMALLHLLPLQAPLGVVLSGIGILLGNVLVVHRLALRLTRSSQVAVLAAATVASSYALIFWSLRGFEVGLLALLIDAAVLLTLDEALRTRDVAVAALLLCAAVLTRSDALVPTLVIALSLAQRTMTRRGLALAASLLACVLVVLGLHTYFRLAYYGSPLPNTYYLKMEGISLGTRLDRGLPALATTAALRLLPLLALTAVSFLLAPRGQRRTRSRELLLLAVFAGQAAYSAYVGGDAWEAFGIENRYLTVGLAPLIVLAALGYARMREHACGARRPTLLLAVRCALAVTFVAVQAWLAALGTFELVAAIVASAVAGLTVLSLGRAGLEVLPARRGASLVLLVAIALFLQAFPLAAWARRGAKYAGDDAGMSRAGLTLRRATPPDTVIATLSSGSLPYYAERRIVDLLGKCDAVIAHRPPVLPFVPGHNKFDVRYSLEQRPHLMQGLPEAATPAEVARTEQQYLRLPDGWRVRRDAAAAMSAALPGLAQGGWNALVR